MGKVGRFKTVNWLIKGKDHLHIFAVSWRGDDKGGLGAQVSHTIAVKKMYFILANGAVPDTQVIQQSIEGIGTIRIGTNHEPGAGYIKVQGIEQGRHSIHVDLALIPIGVEDSDQVGPLGGKELLWG